ncbi:MAG: GNAT family N-acetyltransferase [Ilumatobacteraceae bacterium]
MTIDYRPLRVADYDELATLFTEASIADGRPVNEVGEEIREDFESRPVDLASHTFSAWDGERLIGASYAYHVRSEERQECCYVCGTVHPDFRGRGVGRRLFLDASAVAERLLRASSSRAPKMIRSDASGANVSAMRLYEREGLRPVRCFADLRRPLDSVPEPLPADGFQVMPWDTARSEEIRAVKNLAFRDHWGSSAVSQEHWEIQAAGFGARPDLSFVAVSPAGNIVGYLLSHRYENDESLLGARYAWVDNIGTLAEWRGRGVASALLAAALAAYRDAGMDFAAIDVDSDNPTGAYRLYESLGFAPWRQTMLYQRDVGVPE